MALDTALDSFLNSSRFQRMRWLLERLEGFRATVYPDIGGYYTIGYGHQILGSLEKDPALQLLNLTLQHVTEGLSQETANHLLAHDLMYRANIQTCFNTDLEENVWIALTSFCFNVGLSRFQQSKAFKFFHLNNLYQTAESLSSWRGCEYAFSEGIAKRRLCEVMILLQKPLTIDSLFLPSKQFESPYPMTFTDDNWTKVSSPLKEEAIDLYHQYRKKFHN